MPEPDYVWLPRADLLTFEEMGTLVDALLAEGVDKVRLTGGEPLLRRELPVLVESLAGRTGVSDLAITTNGVLLEEQAPSLLRAGLHRVTVSLDTLDPVRFTELTRSRDHARVLAGIEAARVFPGGLKIDTVVIRGINEAELVPIIEFGKRANAEVRFIEYMDVGGATRWRENLVVPRREMLARLAAEYGPIEPLGERGSAPAHRHRLADGTIFGIIASTTEPFCADCDRVRLTADGMLYMCLYATQGLDLRGPLRAGASPADLRALVSGTWRRRQDRGAEERLGVPSRATFVPLSELRRDAHLEMHTRGG
jgi:cyclic pyranopterin phosphate synthase